MDKIKTIRQSLHMSQQELADKTGISRVYISQLENGKAKNVSVEIIKKLSVALNTPMETFFSP